MIILLTEPNNSNCNKTRNWLNKNKIDFVDYNVRGKTIPVNLATNLGFTELPVILAPDLSWQGHQLNLLKTLISE